MKMRREWGKAKEGTNEGPGGDNEVILRGNDVFRREVCECGRASTGNARASYEPRPWRAWNSVRRCGAISDGARGGGEGYVPGVW